jgi:Na+/proline symporter
MERKEHDMTERRLMRIGLNGIACFLSFSVLGFGLYSAWGIDPRFNPLLSTLYYVLPIASFPVFLIGFVWHRAAILQAILALAYVPVCAILSWRQCSSLGYCTSVASVIFVNIESKQVLAFLGTAIASVAAMVLRERR